jgi:hypothetical protein
MSTPIKIIAGKITVADDAKRLRRAKGAGKIRIEAA